ncbi:Uncharacterised protein [Shewanella baltica]|uniref:hypothetical protein n=1 Tax=Shewanella baltica TaxID=62322 RepID=UPI000F6F7685|nr:hypothetical protein [Shewanella baltica]VEF25754.1 Uncharacterised protein [Shewanella baltica]
MFELFKKRHSVDNCKFKFQVENKDHESHFQAWRASFSQSRSHLNMTDISSEDYWKAYCSHYEESCSCVTSSSYIKDRLGEIEGFYRQLKILDRDYIVACAEVVRSYPIKKGMFNDYFDGYDLCDSIAGAIDELDKKYSPYGHDLYGTYPYGGRFLSNVVKAAIKIYTTGQHDGFDLTRYSNLQMHEKKIVNDILLMSVGLTFCSVCDGTCARREL